MKLHQFFHLLGANAARLFPEVEVGGDFENALVLISGWSAQSDLDPELVGILQRAAAPGGKLLDQLQIDLAPAVAARLQELAEAEAARQKAWEDEQAEKRAKEQEAIAEAQRVEEERRAKELERAVQRALEMLRKEQIEKSA